jgi:hypothetical protein
MDHYAKIDKRIKAIPGFSFIDPILSEKKRILLKMEKELSEINVDLYTCCEEDVLNVLPSDSNIRKSSCIPNDFFVKLFGGSLSFKRDTGQRSSKGCGCMISVDVGSYHLHPCYHNCLFCYANPTVRDIRENTTL